MASTARGQPPQMILIDLESQAPGLTIDSARSAAPPGEKRESGSHYIEMASTATGQPPPYDPYRPGEESQACHNPVQGLTIDSARNAGLSSHSNTSKLKHLHGCLIKFARGI
ncbi:hypothetical protein E4U24_003058 [Claviceps purpurea]|nr:hypothetical protein E4U24_003058 [Claviceps purpurea]